MRQQSLQFLEADAEHLVQIYRAAERLWTEDPAGACSRLRNFAEALVDDVCNHRGLRTAKNLNDGLSLLKGSGLDDEVWNRLERLRQTGNPATHIKRGYKPPPAATAVRCLSDAHALARWYFVEVLKRDAKIASEFEPPPPQASLQIFRDSIMERDHEAQFQVGLALLHRAQAELAKTLRESPIAMTFGFEHAAEWFTKAYKHVPAAAAHLAWLYLEGLGVEKDDEFARRLLEWAAGRGDTVAHSLLGGLYLLGRAGCAVDYPKAMQHLLAAAEKDDLDALNLLAAVYAEGLGTAPDQQKAFDFALKAAEAGHAVAKRNVGAMFESGTSVVHDPNQAFTWYRRAADDEYAEAFLDLARCYEQGIGVVVDRVKRADCIKAAADYGVPAALFELGHLYRTGDGLDGDLLAALGCFEGFTKCPGVDAKLQEAARSLARETMKVIREEARVARQPPSEALMIALASHDHEGNPIPGYVHPAVKEVRDLMEAAIPNMRALLHKINPELFPEG